MTFPIAQLLGVFGALGVVLFARPHGREPSSAPGGSVAPAGGGLPPMSGGGRAFVAALGETPTASRDAAILAAVRAGFIPPLTWYQVDCSRDGVEASCWVSGDCLAVGTAADWVRVNVGNDTAQRCADALGALLPTSRIDDRAWQQATVRLTPHTQTPDAHMADTSRMVRHHDAIEAERGGRSGLARPLGKTYYLSPKMTAPWIWFGGWHQSGARSRSPDGCPIIQGIGTGNHEVSFKDYSHHPTFVHHRCLVAGVERELAEVLAHPTDCRFFSAEGPTPARHPSVPQPDPGVMA